MSVFAYRGLMVDGGGSCKGTITADTPRAARDQLRARGMKVRRLTTVQSSGSSAADGRTLVLQRFTASRQGNRVAMFLGELATLLSAGVPLLDAIDSFIRQTKRSGFCDGLMTMRERVAAGVSLADAMREQPLLFDDLCVSMVEVGERSGKLDEVLRQLATFKQRGERLKSKLGTALIYPAIVLTAGVAVTLFLMTFVVPRLLESLIEAGQTLPWMTQAVKAVSDVLVGYGLWIPVAVLPIVLLAAWLMRRPQVRRSWHRLQLRIPIVGELIRKQAMVRIAVTLATLTRSGMPFIEAVRIVRRTMPNLVIHDALADCEDAVGAGRDIAPSLEATGVFPHAMILVFSVGQASGRLDELLERIAADYDEQVNTLVQRLVAVLEPILILMLAVFVGVIVLAVILPYMEAGNVM